MTWMSMLVCEVKNTCTLPVEISFHQDGKTTRTVLEVDQKANDCREILSAKVSLETFPTLTGKNATYSNGHLNVTLGSHSVTATNSGDYVLIAKQTPKLTAPIDKVNQDGTLQSIIPHNWSDDFESGVILMSSGQHNTLLQMTEMPDNPKVTLIIDNQKGETLQGKMSFDRSTGMGTNDHHIGETGTCTAQASQQCSISTPIPFNATSIETTITHANGTEQKTRRPLMDMPDYRTINPICFFQKGELSKLGELGKNCDQVRYKKQTLENAQTYDVTGTIKFQG